MNSNIHLLSNIYIIQNTKNLENDREFHTQIRGRKAIRELLNKIPSHSLSDEQRFQLTEEIPCAYADGEYTFGFIKEGDGRLIYKNRCTKKQRCDVYSKGKCM